MLGLKRLATALRGARWLLSPSGLRRSVERAVHAAESARGGPEFDERVDRRVDARIEALAGAVARLEERVGARIEALAGAVAHLDGRMERLESLVVGVDSHLHVRGDGMVMRLDGILRRLDESAKGDHARWADLIRRFELEDRLLDELRRDLGRLGQGALEQITRALHEGREGRAFFSARLDEIGGTLGGVEVRTEAGLKMTDVLYQHVADASQKANLVFNLLRSRAEIFGHPMYLDPSDSIVSPMLLRDGYFEPYETELIQAEVRPGDVVVDVGANIGYYTLILARLVGEAGRVYAFEPDPTNFELLKRNVRVNGHKNVVLVQKAVSDAPGELTLFLCPDNKGDHRIYDSHDDRRAIRIEATTLDDYFADLPGRVDFIKMDIQGAEGRALRGMTRLLAGQSSVKLVTEFWPAGLRRSGVGPEEYLADLQRLGFALARIDEEAESREPITPAELLAAFPDGSEQFTNLFCTRSAQAALPAAGPLALSA